MLYQFKNKRGAALILVFLIFVGLSGIAFVFLTMVRDEIGSAGAGLWNIQAFYLAEAGLAKARWALTVGGETLGEWEGEEDIAVTVGTTTIGTYTIDPPVDNDDGTCTITTYGYVPNDNNPLAKRQVVEENIPVGGDLTNLSLVATISASSEKLPPNPATNANDGDSGTQWKAGSKDDAWLKLDFGSAATFDRVIFTGNNINSVTIYYSSNDSDYTEVTNAVEDPGRTVNFDSVSAQYLRLDMDVDSNKTAEINEFESYNSAEDVSATLGQGEFSTSW